ncbi:MoxR-like ATPase [Catenulispora sp. MAP12-49]|jgi:MoxR-like ATPase
MPHSHILMDVIGEMVIGKPATVELAVVCLLSEGHLLIEDVPGTGKTTLARAMAAAIDTEWRRIQFTPDLLPADITGTSVLDPRTGEFEFRPGPVFAEVVIADEINRASPKTQSALLEVMEERQVTVDGTTHPARRPFLVVATQNPVDMEGTYALPEAQLDRFLMRLRLGHLEAEEELAVIRSHQQGHTVQNLRPVMNRDSVLRAIGETRQITVAETLARYVVDLARATRDHPHVRHGASTRATLALVRSAQSLAYVRGRPYATSDDVRLLAAPVLAHRLVLSPQAELDGVQAEDVVRDVLAHVRTPDTAGSMR